MINHVYVPKGKTGFELPLDDQHQRKIKHASEKFASDINRSFRIFKDTFTRFWDNVIDKFISIDVKHADVIFLHLLLLWNPQSRLSFFSENKAASRFRKCHQEHHGADQGKT